MTDDELNERLETVIHPDLIVGKYFLLFMPWTITSGANQRTPLIVNFGASMHAWAALIKDIDFILNGGIIKHPSARRHCVDGTKFTVRTRPEARMHLMISRPSQIAQIGFNEAELVYLKEAMQFHYKRSTHAQATKIIYP